MGELIDKAKGKAKQAAGKLTGNRVREAEGIADEAKGKAKGAFEEIKTDAKRSVRESQERRPADRR